MSAYNNVQTFAFQVIPRVILVAYNRLRWAVILDRQRRAERASSQQLHRCAAPSPQRDQSLGTWLERTTDRLRDIIHNTRHHEPHSTPTGIPVDQTSEQHKGPLAYPMSAVFRTTAPPAHTGPNHSYMFSILHHNSV